MRRDENGKRLLIRNNDDQTIKILHSVAQAENSITYMVWYTSADAQPSEVGEESKTDFHMRVLPVQVGSPVLHAKPKSALDHPFPSLRQRQPPPLFPRKRSLLPQRLRQSKGSVKFQCKCQRQPSSPYPRLIVSYRKPKEKRCSLNACSIHDC